MRSKKALKNIIVSFLLQIITIICGFVIPKMIIQNFGSNVNGLVSSIAQFLTYITLLESGIGPVVRAALYKPIAEKNNKQIANVLKASENFFKTLACIFIIYILILSMVYPTIINNEFESLYTISLLLIIATSTFAEYFFGMTYKLFLHAEQKSYIVSTIQIVTTIINTITVIILIKFGCNIHTVKLASAVIFIFRPILQNIYVRKKYNINLKEADKNYKLEKKWDGLAQHIASVVHENTDVAILTIFSTMTEVSVYSVYLLVVNGIKNLVQAFTGGIDASFGDMIAKNEKETLNKSFKNYELLYFTIITIFFACTMLLIVPFVKVYTAGIQDVNYSRPVFAFIIVLAEFIFSIRIPYNSLALVAGHFKETKKGAWVEAGVNIIISIILVIKLGIIGVAIGTLIAMLVRTIEFIVYTSKNILERNILECVKKIIIIIIQLILIYMVKLVFLNNFIVNSYLDWFIYAIIIGITVSAIVLSINTIVYKSDIVEIINQLKNITKKKK